MEAEQAEEQAEPLLGRQSDSEDDGESQAHMEMELVRDLNRRLSIKDLQSIALCCRALDILQTQIDNTKDVQGRSDFVQLYNVIREKVVGDAPSLLRLFLVRIRYKPTKETKSKIKALPKPDTESLYKKYPDLDMLLTLANMVASMSNSDFDTFKNYHTPRNTEYGLDAITYRCKLLELMLDNNTCLELGKITKSFNDCHLSYPKELVRYLKRHRQPVPIQWSLCCKRTCKVSFILCVLSLVAVALLCVFMTVPNFIKEFEDFQQYNRNYTIGANATAMVGECFDPNVVSNVTALSQLTDGTKVYKIRKKDVLSRSKPLKFDKHYRFHTMLDPMPLPQIIGWNPLYNADGPGMANFSITLTNYNTSRTTCAIRMVAFNSPSHYFDYTNDHINADPLHIPLNDFNYTTCVGANKTYNFPIPLVSNSYYYFVISHIIDIEIVVNISGNVYEYYLKPTQESYCTLKQSDTCTINISESEECSYNNDNSHDDDKWCLLTTSSSENRGNMNLEVVPLCKKEHKFVFFAYPGGAGVLSLLTFAMCILSSLCCAVFYAKRNNASRRYTGDQRLV